MDTEQSSQYRRGLLEAAHVNDAYFDANIDAAKKSGDVDEIKYEQRRKTYALRYNLKMARWNEAYWQARFAKLGYNSSGEMEARNPDTGMTARETAEYTRLVNILEDFTFGTNLVEVLDIGVDLPGNIFSSPKTQNLAERVLDNAVSYALTAYEHEREAPYLSRVEEFAQKFNIERGIWEPKIIRLIENSVNQGQWTFIEKLLKIFPFIKPEFPKKLHKESFYGELDGAKEQDIENIFGFSREELETGGQVTVAELLKRLQGKERKLADCLAKVPDIYFELRSDLSGSRPLQSGFGKESREPFNRIRLVPEPENEKAKAYKVKLCFLLGSMDNNDLTRLELTLAQNKIVSRQNERGYSNHFYLGTNTFELDRAAVTNKPFSRNYRQEEAESKYFDYVIGQDVSEAEGKKIVDVSLLEKLAQVSLKPERDLTASLDKLDLLAKKYEIETADLENLKMAIREFAKYSYPVTSSDVGDCLLTPNDFQWFCRLKFRLESDTGRYGQRHPEWGSDSGYDPCTFHHEVNVVFGKVVIDWTVTQYRSHQDRPVPYIYEIGDELKAFGPLFSIGGGETPNDPYPGTSLPEGYEIHYGI